MSGFNPYKVVLRSYLPRSYLPKSYLLSVKNRFSNPTKVQIGRDRQRKDMTNKCQEKALREGCHEREQAQTGVFPTGKTNTKGDLARVTTKSKSRMQTVTNGCVSQKDNESCCWRVFQCQRPHRVSRIEAQNSQDNVQEGQRLIN